MIGSYITGILPRPKKLIDKTRDYARERANPEELDKAFAKATQEAIAAQVSVGFSHVTDGMLKWHDLLRPFTEKLSGVKIGSLARWFNNNTFYRKPVIVGEISRARSITSEIGSLSLPPKDVPWKAILPAPFTFAQLSQNKHYGDSASLMFAYARILREEIVDLAKMGFAYVQLSDPALVYSPIASSISKDTLNTIREALNVAVRGAPVKICLHTFFGDFSQLLPAALDFPVDHLGIDLYETDLNRMRGYEFEKGVALGLLDSRSSLIEDSRELVTVAKRVISTFYGSELRDIFICPNCDLEFLPFEVAKQKMQVAGSVAAQLREESS